jgi:hypothetical protein
MASFFSCTGLAAAVNSLFLIIFTLFPIQFKRTIFSFKLSLAFSISKRTVRYFCLFILLFALFLVPFGMFGLFIKASFATPGTDIIDYFSFSWLLDRLSPQYFSFISSLDSANHSQLGYLSDYFANAYYRFEVILHSLGFFPFPQRPPVLLDVHNAIFIQAESLPLTYRSGTSPGLIASLNYIYGVFSPPFLLIYTYFVYLVLRPIISTVTLPLSPQLYALLCWQLLPIFFQSPFSLLLLFDESLLLVLSVVWLRHRVIRLSRTLSQS